MDECKPLAAANLDEYDARVAAANAARAAEAAQAAIKTAQEAAQYARDVEARIKHKRENRQAKIVEKLGRGLHWPTSQLNLSRFGW